MSSSTNGSSAWRIDLGALVVVAALGGAAYFAHVQPTMDRFSAAQAQARDLTSQHAQERQLQYEIKTTRSQLASENTRRATYELKLETAAAALNDRLAKLGDLASRNKLQVDSIESSATTASLRFCTTPIRLVGRGSWRDCSAALHELRTQMPDIAVMSVQLTANAGVGAIADGTIGKSDTPAAFAIEFAWYTQPLQPGGKK